MCLFWNSKYEVPLHLHALFCFAFILGEESHFCLYTSAVDNEHSPPFLVSLRNDVDHVAQHFLILCFGLQVTNQGPILSPEVNHALDLRTHIENTITANYVPYNCSTNIIADKESYTAPCAQTPYYMIHIAIVLFQ